MTQSRFKPRKPSLRWVLAVPVVLQICGAVGLVGYFSFRNGQQAVDTLAMQLQRETSERLAERLHSFLTTPKLINRLIADDYQRGELRLDLNPPRAATVERYLWHQMQLFPEVTWISLGTAAGGEFIGITRQTDAQRPQLGIANQETAYRLHYYALDANGGRQAQLRSTPDRYDVRDRPLYQVPAAAGRLAWGEVYAGIITQTLYLSLGQPLYDDRGQLQGVVAVDFTLSKLAEMLRDLEFSQAGRILILERDGHLVADSSGNPPFRATETVERLTLDTSEDALVRATGEHLRRAFPDWDTLTQPYQSALRFRGDRYLFQVMPFADEQGLDWLIVTVVPASEFMAVIQASSRQTLLLCLLALVTALGFSLYTARWLSGAIARIGVASEAIASGQLLGQVPEERIQELDHLVNTFNHMARQLHQSFQDLAAANEQLEERVHERTAALSQALERLKGTQAKLIHAEKMSSLGQMVAGIAHEINNPVNFIRGNLDHARYYLQDLLELQALYQRHCDDQYPELRQKAEALERDFIADDFPKLLNSIQVGAERIQTIVTGLRNFSRLNEAEWKQANLNEGLQNTLLIVRHRLLGRGDYAAIALTEEYGELPLVWCYPSQLNQVFLNLLNNAIDALEPLRLPPMARERPPCLAIATALREDWIQIRIGDNGMGIPEQHHSKLFDPFFTTKEVGKGTGLGLSISHQIVVEEHQGRLTFQSQVDVGTEFVVELPLGSPTPPQSLVKA